ncbi:MAG: HEAT repeat domain-containing protein [Candidatus Omnitrophica bacterium]|nr:HEAT repeat domain-containing protein [Candidatus Omnitrophota bacterium]
MKLVPAMIRSLRLGTQNVRLYPAHSSIRKDFIDQADKHLGNILTNDNIIIIGTAEGRLLINGEEVSERDSKAAGSAAFVEIMIESRIRSINLKKGFTKEQLAILLEGLSQNYDDLISQGGLSGMLRKSGVSAIRVNEVTYVSSSQLGKQRSRLEDGLLIDYLLGRGTNLKQDNTAVILQLANDPQRLANTLIQIAGRSEAKGSQDKLDLQAETVVSSLQKINDQLLIKTKGTQGDHHQKFAEAVLALDPGLRSRVLQTKGANSKVLTDKTKPQDLIKEIMAKFSDDQALRIVTEEHRRSPQDLTNVNNLIRKLLTDKRRKQRLAPQLKQRLLKLGLSPEEVSLMLEGDLWQGLSTEEKVKRFLELTPESYLKFEREITENIEKLISELLENNRYNQANAIIDKLLKQLEDGSSQVRSKTVKILVKISQTLVARQKQFLLEQIISAFLDKLDKEQVPEVYSFLAGGLAVISAQLLKKQNFIQAAGILRELNFRMGKESKLADTKKQVLINVKSEIVAIPEIVDSLAKSLKEKIEQHHEFWELSKVISEIGAGTVQAIFDLAISKGLYSDPFETYAFRWSIAKVFKPMGEKVISFLKKQLLDKKAENIKVALQLLGHMQNQAVVKHLRPLLKHKDLNVRKDVITTLGKISGSEAIKLLSEAISDKQIQIRWAVIWALANIGGAQVLPLLKPLLLEQEFSDQVKRIIRRIENK